MAWRNEAAQREGENFDRPRPRGNPARAIVEMPPMDTVIKANGRPAMGSVRIRAHTPMTAINPPLL
jgi:hypothetical protein